MKFVDEVEIDVRGGHGGAGCVSFRREKYRPKGGPAGGNGGNGGSVILTVDSGMSTLLDFRYRRRLFAENGQPGRGKDQYGRNGQDIVARVPPGTVVRDVESGTILADLRKPGDSAVIARGGRGGRGNACYATSTRQAPRYAQPGIPGEERRLRLELRVMADVGLLGLPNAGKSTLIRRVSAARPRVANYPFTTLVPHLGVVPCGDLGSFVLADIPGLVEGAHQGHGLGHRFLRHLSRTRFLIHLIDIGTPGAPDPLEAFASINRELALFDAGLAAKPQIVAGNKVDLLPSEEDLEEIRKRFLDDAGVVLHPISAATGLGVEALIRRVGSELGKLPPPVPASPQPEDPAKTGDGVE